MFMSVFSVLIQSLSNVTFLVSHIIYGSCLEKSSVFGFSSVFQADPQFVWNKNLLDELIEHKVSYSFH